MSAISLLSGGKRMQANNSRTFERRNALDGKVATTAPAATVAHAIAAVDAAANAFPA